MKHYTNPRRKKNIGISDKKDLYLSVNQKYETIKRRNVGPSFLKPLTNSFKYIFEVTFIFQHNNIYLQFKISLNHSSEKKTMLRGG